MSDLGLTFPRVLASEWVKFRTLRSSWVTLATVVGFVIGLSALICGVTAARWDQETVIQRLSFDPAQASLGGVFLGQLAIGVLGVLMVTAEYSSGMVRATFAAVPRRLPVLAAKVVVFAAVCAAVAIPSTFAGFLLGQLLLSSVHVQTSLSADGVARAVIGAGLYLVAIGLFGVALGWLLRHTAGAISTLFGLLLIVPVIATLLPGNWADDVSTWLPSDAGQAVFSVGQSDLTSLGPWTGYGVLLGWVLLFLVAAAYVLEKRDV